MTVTNEKTIELAQQYFSRLQRDNEIYFAYFMLGALEIGKHSKCPKCVLYISALVVAGFVTLVLLGYITTSGGGGSPSWCTYYC